MMFVFLFEERGSQAGAEDVSDVGPCTLPQSKIW